MTHAVQKNNCFIPFYLLIDAFLLRTFQCPGDQDGACFGDIPSCTRGDAFFVQKGRREIQWQA
jgi:hypothetical protein